MHRPVLWMQIEAVRNHTPEMVLVDELGTEKEMAAARPLQREEFKL